MTRLAAAAALLALLITSCAATLRVSGTTPTTLQEGTCARFTETPAYAAMWVVARVDGTAFADSLWLAPGTPFTFSWTLPPGPYTVTAWARNRAGASCSTSVQAEATSRPAPVRLAP